jgi:hypothetical protein
MPFIIIIFLYYYYYYYKPNYKIFFWFVFRVLQLPSTFYLELYAYFDVGHDNNPTDGKSVTSFYIFLGDSLM